MPDQHDVDPAIDHVVMPAQPNPVPIWSSAVDRWMRDRTLRRDALIALAMLLITVITLSALTVTAIAVVQTGDPTNLALGTLIGACIPSLQISHRLLRRRIKN